MLAFCVCPPATALTEITPFTCGEDFGQIQKLALQRRQATAPFATAVAAGTKANWQTFLDAADSTKVVVTPFFDNFVIPPVEAILEGGDDNTTLDGAPIVVGQTTPAATGMFRSLPSATFEQIQLLNCEATLTWYGLNEFSKIIGYSANGTTFAGIPLTEFFIGDKGAQGKNTQDKSNFRFNLRAGWSKKLKIVTPVDFDPLWDLVPS